MVAVVILLFGFLGAAMIGDLLALLFPYLPLVVLCVAQFLRPTLLGWFALTALFASYTVAVAVSFQLPTGEYVPFLLIGGIPTIGLLWSWPRPVERLQKTDQ